MLYYGHCSGNEKLAWTYDFYTFLRKYSVRVQPVLYLWSEFSPQTKNLPKT